MSKMPLLAGWSTRQTYNLKGRRVIKENFKVTTIIQVSFVQVKINYNIYNDEDYEANAVYKTELYTS